MIRLQNLTPEVYYKQSRDFQFIGRLYDIVLNSVKTNTANLYNLPIGPNMNEQLLNLLALTLGFKPKKNYNSKQLLAICSVLPEILKHKGSMQAILIAVNALLAAEEITQPLDYLIQPKKSITLYVSQKLSDLTLLTDLFEYILPAGISYNLVKENQLVTALETNIVLTDHVEVEIKPYNSTVVGIVSNLVELDPVTNNRIINTTGITHEIVGAIDLTKLTGDALADYFKNSLPVVLKNGETTLLANNLTGDYEMSMDVIGTISSAVTSEVKYRFLAWYLDDNNYAEIFVEWQQWDRSFEIRSIQVRTVTNGVERKEIITIWGDNPNNNTLPADGFTLTVKKTGNKFAIKLVTKLTNITKQGSVTLPELSDLEAAYAVKVIAVGDTFTVSNVSNLKCPVTQTEQPKEDSTNE